MNNPTTDKPIRPVSDEHRHEPANYEAMPEGVELKPCRWCEDDDATVMVDLDRPAHWCVQCRTCGATGPVKPNQSKAIEAWNHRLTTLPAAGGVDGDESHLVLQVLNALHDGVPEWEPVMSLSDLSDSQVRRVRAAISTVAAWIVKSDAALRSPPTQDTPASTENGEREGPIWRAGKCGKHFDPDCEGCIAALDYNNAEMDKLRSPTTSQGSHEGLIEQGNARGVYDTTKLGPELVAFLNDRAGMLAALRDEMSEGYRGWLDDAVAALRTAEERCADAITAQAAEIAELREGLKTFADFAATAVNDEGWSGTIQRERIVDWFGPSDFRRARALLSKAKADG